MSFQYIKPTEEQIKTIQLFRDKFEALSKEVAEIAPSSRGTSICLTKLEEASFWLNKGITHNS